MPNKKWVTKETDEFISKNYSNMTFPKMVEILINQFPNLSGILTERMVSSRANKLIDNGTIMSQKKNNFIKYSEEELEWVKRNVYNCDNFKELTNLFNKKFKKNKSLLAIHSLCSQKLNLKFHDEKIKYSKEQEKWLINNFDKYCMKELTKKFNEKFNVSRSVSAIRNHCYTVLNLRQNNYNDYVNKIGYKAANTKNIGYEKFDGKYWWVKIANNKNCGNKNYMLKQRYIWEQYHGKIKDGHRVVFLDENKSNFDINNLVCVKNDIEGTLSKMKNTSASLKKCKIASMKLNQILNELEI